MPRSAQVPSHAPAETPAGLRAMAGHARRLARDAGDQEAKTKLIEFAEELEARAAALGAAPQTFSHEDVEAIQRVEKDTDPDQN